jgi:hypothetical protein
LREGAEPQTEVLQIQVSEERKKISLRAQLLSHPAQGSSDERLREGAEPQTEVFHI